MPSKFAEFELPKGAEGLRTDKEGYAAMEQAGRRVGQLYGQAGSDYAAIGRLEDEAFRAQDFPLDFAAFSSGSTRGAGAGGGGGGGFKVSGDINSFFNGGRGASSDRGSGRGYTPQTDRTARSAAELVSTWGGNTPDILRGGRAPQNGQGGPKDVPQGALTDPFSPAYSDAQQQPSPQSNWNYSPQAIQREELPGSTPAPAAADTGGGGVGQFFSDMWSSVTSAVGSAGAGTVDSSAPDIGSY